MTTYIILHSQCIYFIITVGDKMNRIEIFINNTGNNRNILIDTINHKIKINNQEKEITEEKIYELLRIIRTWKPIYQKPKNLLEAESFLIKINTNESTDTIKGTGAYPENYAEFKHWIGEFYD